MAVQLINTTFDKLYNIYQESNPGVKYLVLGLTGDDGNTYLINIPTSLEKSGGGSITFDSHINSLSNLPVGWVAEPYSSESIPEPTPTPSIEGISFSFNDDTNMIIINDGDKINTFKIKDSHDIVFKYIAKALSVLSNTTSNFEFSYNEDSGIITVKDNGSTTILKLGRNKYDVIFKYIFKALTDLIEGTSYITSDVDFEDVQPDSNYDDKVIIGYNDSEESAEEPIDEPSIIEELG